MIDREKVMKGLECCKWSDAGLYEGYAVESALCEICPYHDEHKQMGECHEDLRCDALEMLKGQEPVEPIRQWDDDETTWWYSCGSCVQAVDCKDKYCRHCGKGLKWDASI